MAVGIPGREKPDQETTHNVHREGSQWCSCPKNHFHHLRHGVTGTTTKEASHTYNKKFSHAIIVIPNTFAGAKLLISYQTTKQKGEEAHADDRRKAPKQPFVSYDKQR